MRTEIAPFPETQPAENVCVWDAPDGAYRVELKTELIRELRYAAIQAFLAIPKRGLEIGGLLLGRVREGWPTVFELTGFEEVPCEHRFGPAYTLDEHDRVTLATTIARYPQDGVVRAIGLYRSYTGRDAEPDQADRELVRAFFRSRKFACLVLQLDSRDSCLADFRFWNDGEMQFPQTRPMFQFDPTQMERHNTAIASVADQTEDAAPAAKLTSPKQGFTPPVPLPGLQPPASTASTVWSEPQEVEGRRERLHPIDFHSRPYPDPQLTETEESNPKAAFWFRVSAILLFIAVAAPSVLLYELRPSDHYVPWAAVNLDARRDADGFLLTWDPKAPVMASVESGSLQVDDGKKPVAVHLTKEQLLRGSMAYPDTGSNVLFSLNLNGNESMMRRESLRVITRSIPAEATNSPLHQVTDTPAPKSEVTSGTESARIGSDTAIGDTAVKPASIRREIHPQIPAGIRSRIATRQVVEVHVRIDKRGRVISAASTEVASNSVDQYLADQAVKAARQWLFWPAKSAAGQPITTTKTIPFEFMPSEQ